MSTPQDDNIQKAIAALSNDRHRLFVAAYIRTIANGKPNGAESYRQAGYSTKSPQIASAAADRLLNRVEIKSIIDAARAQAKAASSAEADEAVGSLAWKRERLIEITRAGLSSHKDDQGRTKWFDIKASTSALGLLAKIDGDEKPQEHIHRAHESLLEMLR